MMWEGCGGPTGVRLCISISLAGSPKGTGSVGCPSRLPPVPCRAAARGPGRACPCGCRWLCCWRTVTPASAFRCTHRHPPAHPGWAQPHLRPAVGRWQLKGRRGVRPSPAGASVGVRDAARDTERALTHFISRSVKMRLSRHMRSGTVRMRMKGKAREATVDMTAQSTARHASCSPVKRCMRNVRTCMGTAISAKSDSCNPPPTPAQLPTPGTPH